MLGVWAFESRKTNNDMSSCWVKTRVGEDLWGETLFPV